MRMPRRAAQAARLAASAPDVAPDEYDAGAPAPHTAAIATDDGHVALQGAPGDKADQYLKLVAAGEMNDNLLEALEDYIRRQRSV